MENRWLRVSASLLVTTLIGLSFGACGGHDAPPPVTPTTPSRPTPPPPSVTSVSVSGVGALGIGENGQFSATAHMSDGTEQSCSASATWQSSNASIANVTGSGVVTAVAAGDADIRATCAGTTGSLHLTVPSVTYTLSGTVIDEAGARVSEAAVELADGPMAGKTATTDAVGGFVLSHVATGTISVKVTKAGYDARTQTVILVRNTSVVFSLRHTVSVAYTVSGVVRDDTGAPLFMATVLVMNGPSAGRAANTTSTGTYSVANVAGGACDIRASKYGYTGSTQSVTIAADTTLDFTLKKQ